MSETRIEYLQGERESEIRKRLREMKVWEVMELIAEEIKSKDFDDYKELLIEFIIEKGYMDNE